MRRGSFLAAVLAVMSTYPAQGQGASALPSRQDAMKRFELWIGRWTGSGWSIDATGRRTEFDLSETVQPRVGGTVLLVEGQGTAKPGNGNIVVTHDGLSLFYYDEHTARYRWSGHELTAGTVDTEVTPVPGGLQWSIRAGGSGAAVRFTIRFDKNAWHEVGEAGADGKTWSKFMEMNLERVQP